MITTVNVPDRLDVQEVRARADEDNDDRSWIWRARLETARVWFFRLAIAALLVAAALFGWDATAPWRDDFTPPRIAERLSQTLGSSVTLADTRVQVRPTPRFVLVGLDLGEGLRFEEVAIHFNWDDAWRAVRGGGWVWGEVTVPAQRLELNQAQRLVELVGRFDAALPKTISTVRFESLELAGAVLLPGKYEATIRRGAEGAFEPVLLQSAAQGRMQLRVRPVVGDDMKTVAFELDATDWRLPVALGGQWNEARFVGRVQPNLVAIDEFLLVGFYGSLKGAAYAAEGSGWTITGYAKGTTLDIEAVLKHLRGAPVEGQSATVPMSGTMGLDLLLGGKGATLREAINQAVAAGPFQVRWAALHGINLGYAATRPGAGGVSGGLTRFTQLAGNLAAGKSGVRISGIRGRAGALAAHGELGVAPDLRLTGVLNVDLGATRVQAPLNLKVHGTALAPEFGRR